MRKYSVFLLFLFCISALYAVQPIVKPLGIINAPGEIIIKHDDIFNLTNEHNYADPWLRDTSELFWDDGGPEGYYVVSGIPGIYDRFAVRFQIPYSPPMKVVGGRFYTDNSVIPLQSFSVCRDAGGYPDVFHPVDKVDDVYGGYPGWGNYEFHGALFDTNDIWTVVHWIPGYVVGIGADSTLPDGYSYWCNEKTATNWNLFSAADWMLRLSVAEVTDSHDVTAVTVLEPTGYFLPGDTMNPTAVFGNCGLSAETFDVTYDITDSIGGSVYTASSTLTLASAEVETLIFSPDWVTLVEGMYDFTAYTSLSGDIDPANDTTSMQGLCTYEIIITYCGDYTNMGSAIIGTWATNRKYLVRMTPPIPPPFYLKRSQIFLCDANAPMEYVCICPDNGSGLPDTSIVLASGFNVSVSQSHTWATVDYGEIEVTDSSDLWMIAKWPEGITEPHIGMEINSPSTERSWRYYYRYGAGHYENMGIDPYFREWYYRVIIAVPPQGTEEIVIENQDTYGLRCYPNPGKNQILITCNVPDAIYSEFRIYNAAGRVVRGFNMERSAKSVVWKGDDNHGKLLPAGIYFVELQTQDYCDIKKAVLLR
jgi:hypothetical protein